MRKLDKHYVSETDKFLQEFDKRHPIKSDTQVKEIAKHEPIFKLRDEALPEDEEGEFWSEF